MRTLIVVMVLVILGAIAVNTIHAKQVAEAARKEEAWQWHLYSIEHLCVPVEHRQSGRPDEANQTQYACHFGGQVFWRNDP